MILLNFGPKMQKPGFDQINALTGQKITEQVSLPLEYSDAGRFIQELDALFAKVNLTTDELKKDRYALIPPGNSHAAIVVLIELYRRTGVHPYLLRTRLPLYGFHLGSDVVEAIDLEKEWSEPAKP
jgi:hypothetical protein